MSALSGFLAGSLAFTPIQVDGLFIDGFAGGGGASTGIYNKANAEKARQIAARRREHIARLGAFDERKE